MRMRVKGEMSTVIVPIKITPSEDAKAAKIQKRRGLQYKADVWRTLLAEEWERSEAERLAKKAEKESK